ncbi:MAG: creatininase family protein [Rhizobiaceae bacterium]|nr:creatininase family protein [Rhizobiaceae bacterium]
MTRKVWWNDFTAPDFADLDPMTTIAMIPIAAVEQHGPHLPVGTDTMINQGFLDLLIERLPGDIALRILPIQAVGKSNEHVWAPGTLTHTAANLIEGWTELGLSVARTGIRKIVFVNSHGGNVEMMGIVARELRVKAGILAVKAGWHFPMPDDPVSDQERRHGIHGGEVETALMLHFRPDTVDMSKAADFVSVAATDEERFTHLRPTGTLSYAWIASDLNRAGAVGNAAKGTAELGKRIAEHQVASMIDLLRDVQKADLPTPIDIWPAP